MKRIALFLLSALLILIASCSKDNKSVEEYEGFLPIVLAHGVLASGDTYEKQALRFVSNGYPPELIYTFDWNSIGLGNNERSLDQFINTVLRQTGAPKVNLAGHSAGSNLCYTYLEKPENEAKVANYVHLAGTPRSKAAGQYGGIPTLNIWSPDDLIVAGGNMGPKVTSLKLEGKDHYEVATCAETFAAMYEFFNGEPPATTEILEDEGDEITIRGKALSFGENLVVSNIRVRVFEVNPETGKRLTEDPLQVFNVGANNGFWGPFTGKKNTYYEFEVTGSRRVHYYREPFVKSNNWVYLRAFPPSTSLGAAFLSGLPNSEEQAVSALFSASQAVITGRDELEVDGFTLSTPEFTSPSQSVIALFLYDNNRNSQTDLNAVAAFSSFPFLNAIDMFFPTNEEYPIKYDFNGRKLTAYNWKSKGEGVSVVVFD
jgi:hypothetical protein